MGIGVDPLDHLTNTRASTPARLVDGHGRIRPEGYAHATPRDFAHHAERLGSRGAHAQLEPLDLFIVVNATLSRRRERQGLKGCDGESKGLGHGNSCVKAPGRTGVTGSVGLTASEIETRSGHEL